MSPPNILEVMSFKMSTRMTATVVCCILTQILCVVSQKSSAPGPRWCPRPRLLCPPNNPVRSTPLTTGDPGHGRVHGRRVPVSPAGPAVATPLDLGEII